MSALGNIIKKEVRELMTPTTFIPIILIAILFGSLGNAIGNIEEEIKERPVIGYIDADNSSLSYIATSILDNYAEVIFNSSEILDKENGIETLIEEDGIALFVIAGIGLFMVYFWKNGYYVILKIMGTLESEE